MNKVPEVANARASLTLAQSEFGRIEKLLAERVVSQSEYDQRKTQVEAARQQYESAKNAAEQQYQALQASRARVTLAHKAVADTTVRAPFAGLVAQRMVSTGDYVTRGMKVAEVVRITPLRVELTVPEQFVAEHQRRTAGVVLGRRICRDGPFEGKVRFVSPALRADQRALTVEAVGAQQQARELKPGMFATALIEQSQEAPGRARPCRPRCAWSRARVACSSSTATAPKSASSRPGRRSSRSSRSPPDSRTANASPPRT